MINSIPYYPYQQNVQILKTSAALLGSMKDRPQRSSKESRWSMQENSIRRNTDGNSRLKRQGFKW